MNISDNNIVKTIRHVTMVGFWINAVLVVFKLFFGYWGHSDALVADGYHSVSDFITDFIVIIFAATAYKSADKDHPYGHGKYETFASLVIGVILMLVALFLLYEGIDRIIYTLKGNILERPDVWTIVVAFLSIILKEGCYRYTKKEGQRIESSSLMANAEHHRSDAISSIATLIGVGFAFALGAKWRILDPIASIVISIMIMLSAFKIAKPAIEELLEISLPEDLMAEILKISNNIEGVKKIHHLKGRRNGHSVIIEMNVHVDPNITVEAGHLIASDIENTLRRAISRDMITYIHIEPDV